MSLVILEQLLHGAQNNLYNNILPFWLHKIVDEKQGGFYGTVTNTGQPDPTAPRGLILIARLLWTFSALYAYEKDERYRSLADRAYHYLERFFLDPLYGGAYWLVAPDGIVLNDQKKIYGQAFAIYALSEYFAATDTPAAREQALQIFALIDRHCHDAQYRGYIEAANRDWSPTTNLQLSVVDLNEKKSMNSHLHLMEALANLLRVSQDTRVVERLQELIACHLDHIIDPHTHHLRLFFDEQWRVKSAKVSYGHDIEASWLLCEAGELLGQTALIESIQSLAVSIAEAVAREGIGPLGLVLMERDGDGQLVRTEYDWWPQAEAVVGFLNAYTLSRRPEFLERAWQVWTAIEKYFVDRENGEWFYEVSSQGVPNRRRYKAGEWKCPYHTTRSCLEIIKRAERLINSLGKNEG